MRIKERILYFASIVAGLTVNTGLFSQQTSGGLRFTPGDSIPVQMELKATVTQEALGNAISFDTDASAWYHYNVIESADGKSRLEHHAKRIRFSFDGMGRKSSFDSDRPDDLLGPYGETAKEILKRKFELTIDRTGNVVSTKPEKIGSLRGAEQLVVMMGMISDISDLIEPPQTGKASIFKVLPDQIMKIGDTWADSVNTGSAMIKTVYQLKAITDSTLQIDFNLEGNSVTRAEMMGRETITTLTSNGSGSIVVDKSTGILKEKNQTTNYSGTMEAMGNTTPVTSRTTLLIRIR